MERRLAAILAADVVGYSRLVGTDEEGTLAIVKSLRTEFIEPLIDEHRGRIVKTMGDGFLIEFVSAVDAVRCAVEWQRRLGEHENGAAFLFRIGVNLGDIVVDEDDILGDGVNIAARLEQLADPGGVLLSDMVYQNVKAKLDFGFADAGLHTLKNIDEPLRAWKWTDQLPETGHQVSPASKPDKPSIAVLPFVNTSGRPDQEYIADGITEDIIARLGRCRWLRVIARNSTFVYKGLSVDVRRVAEELDARFVLEGSVRQSGRRLRVTAQLVDGQDGSQLWAEQFDRTLDDLFDLQDEITSVIVGTLEPELEMKEGAALSARRPVELGAWDCYQRALWHLFHFTRDELSAAKELLERAIELDGSFAQAYARLAYVHIQFGWYGDFEDRVSNIQKARKFAGQAVRLDNKDPSGHLSLGRALTLCGQATEGIAELRVAVDLDPSFAQAHFALAQAYCFVDSHKEALLEIDEALRLSPRDPHLWTFLHVRGLANYQAGNLAKAEADQLAALRQPNRTHWPFLILLAILGRQGRIEEAKAAMTQLHQIRPGFSCSDCRQEILFGRHLINSEAFLEQLETDLLSAGLPS